MRHKVLLPRDEAREALGRIAAILRGAGETLQRQFGSEAAGVLIEAMDDAQREIDRCFGERIAADRAEELAAGTQVDDVPMGSGSV